MSEKTKHGGGLRFDTGKLLAYLLPPESIIELLRIFTKGAIKYSDHNWRKGMPWSKCIGPLERHFLKWKMGHVTDQETKCYHIAMVAWNALALLVYQLQGKGFDDRILPEKMTIDDNMNWVELTPAQKALHAKHNNKVYEYIDQLEKEKSKTKPKTRSTTRKPKKKVPVEEATSMQDVVKPDVVKPDIVDMLKEDNRQPLIGKVSGNENPF